MWISSKSRGRLGSAAAAARAGATATSGSFTRTRDAAHVSTTESRPGRQETGSTTAGKATRSELTATCTGKVAEPRRLHAATSVTFSVATETAGSG